MHPPSTRLVLVELGAKCPERRHYYLSEIQESHFNPKMHFLVEQVLARKIGPNGRRLCYVKYRDYHGMFEHKIYEIIIFIFQVPSQKCG